MIDSMTHIYLNPIRTDRASAFEQFLTKVQEAVEAQRPHLVGRWQVLKATSAETGDPSITTYAFIFDGGDLEVDWDLEPLMTAQFGAEEAERLLSGAADAYAPYRDWVTSLGDDVDDRHPQVGWTFARHDPGT